MESKAVQINQIPCIESAATLNGLPALRLLRQLRNRLGADSIGFFETAAVSVIGVDPEEIIVSRNGITTIEREGKLQELRQDPFTVLQDRLAARQIAGRTDLPSFQGGVLGYLSYDAIRFLEPTLGRSGNLSRKSDTYDAELVFYRSYLVFDRRSGHVYLIDATPSLRSALASAERDLASRSSERAGELDRLRETPALPIESMKASLGHERFLEGVKKLKHHLREGDIFQAVLSEQFTHAFDGDPLDLFEALMAVNPAPYHFYFTLQGRAYLGASPEMLVRAEGGQLETHPIAGTRPRGATDAEEKKNEQQLLKSVKERAEHLMLVDLARNDLGRSSAAGTVQVKTFMKLRKFGGVMHLVSEVIGKLAPGKSPIDALSGCFPAGTLSGAPKVRAMELLSEIEDARRGFYGGAFIAASRTGDLESCITIRSLSVHDGVATIQAGAGIVFDSNAEKEYAEVAHKSRLSRQALAIALQLASRARLGAVS